MLTWGKIGVACYLWMALYCTTYNSMLTWGEIGVACYLWMALYCTTYNCMLTWGKIGVACYFWMVLYCTTYNCMLTWGEIGVACYFWMTLYCTTYSCMTDIRHWPCSQSSTSIDGGICRALLAMWRSNVVLPWLNNGKEYWCHIIYYSNQLRSI